MDNTIQDIMDEYVLTICIHGKESDDKAMKFLLQQLQRQLDLLGDNYDVRDIEVIYYQNGQKDNEKRLRWCLAHSSGAYYCEIRAPFIVSPTYVIEQRGAIHELYESPDSLKDKGIHVRQKHQYNPNYLKQLRDKKMNLEEMDLEEYNKLIAEQMKPIPINKPKTEA